MAIENTASQIAYVCDGISTAFPTAWPILDGESVRVIEEMEATGAARPLTLNVDYTVQVQGDDPETGQPGQGLVRVIGAAPSAGRRWHLLRDTRAVQPVQLRSASALPSQRVERTIDRQAMVAQESRRDASKAVRVPDHETVDMALPVAKTRAQKLLAFDADGRPAAPNFTTDQVAAIIDSATLLLLAGSAHEFVSDGTTTVWPLPAEWGLIYAVVSLLVNIGGVGGQTGAYSLTDGAAHGYPGRTVIVFPQPLPVHVPVEVRIPPAAYADGALAAQAAAEQAASAAIAAEAQLAGYVAVLLDGQALKLLAGSIHRFVSDGSATVWPLPAEWGLIYAAVSLLVNIGGVGGQTGAYSLTDGAAHGYPGRTVIVFPQPLPVHVPVEVRVPPAASTEDVVAAHDATLVYRDQAAESAAGADAARGQAQGHAGAAAGSAITAGTAKVQAEAARDQAQGHAGAAAGGATSAWTAKAGAEAARDQAQGHAAAAAGSVSGIIVPLMQMTTAYVRAATRYLDLTGEL